MLCYSYLPNDCLTDSSMVDWGTRYDIALGVARAMTYLHQDNEPTILHGDIKSMNILLALVYEPYLHHKCVPTILHALTIAIQALRHVCILGKNAPHCLF